ncbi:competence type IV pilus minor pilin ComGD [Halobacillus salinus]|nr:competence type IV pilus minor pilin ComGD [Halobacillus salinus]
MIHQTLRKLRLPNQYQFNNKGFTLPEVLVILTVWATLILIFSPLQHRMMDSLKTKQFFSQMESDLLLTQQLTMQKHEGYYLMFRKSKNDYILYDPVNKESLLQRTLPKDWRYQMNTMSSTIRFRRDGTIRQPGSMRFYAGNETYKVTFPFGTSRMRLDEL